MRRALLSLTVLALGALVLPACGEEPAGSQTQITDPTLGVDEDAACLDPSWYCTYIGAIAMNCALGTCGSVNCSISDGYDTQTNTCQNGGADWLVTHPWGLTGGGTYPCGINVIDAYHRDAVIGGAGICQADFSSYYVTDDWDLMCNIKHAAYYHVTTTTDVYQNHYVKTEICPTGFAQCKMSHTSNRVNEWC